MPEPGDIVTVTVRDEPGVQMGSVTVPGAAELTTDVEANVAGVVALRMWEATGDRAAGLVVDLAKGCGIGTGLGSSAASAAAAVVATEAVLGLELDDAARIAFGLHGEALASGSPHADNLAPALLGGIVGIRANEPLDFFRIPVPGELHVAVIHPHVEVLTAEARAALPGTVELATGVAQWGNVASLVAGLYEADYARIGRSLGDFVAEPSRSGFIPGYDRIRSLALEAGALGCGISGSGPSVFALTRGPSDAVAAAWQNGYHDAGFDLYHGPVSREGARLLNTDAV